MEDPALVGILFRLTGYTILFYLVHRWAWEGDREPSWARGMGFALLRMGLGGVVGWLVSFQFELMGPGYQTLQAVLFVVARLFLWVFVFGLAGARTYRLSIGTACGMGLNLGADVVFPRVMLWNLPLYC